MPTSTLPETGTWTLDPAHTTIGFVARHMGAFKVRGSFKSYQGEIRIGDTPEESLVEMTIDAASIDTGTADRDNHLRSPDFLDVERFPHLTFRSTAVRRVDGRYEVEGDLTIRDVARPVTLEVEYRGQANDPWGNARAFFAATTTIDRHDWGLTWNVPLDGGGWLVSREVEIEIEAEAIKG